MLISLSATIQENGWTDLREIFRKCVEWPWDNLFTFCVNSSKPRDAAMLISLSATIWENGWTDLHEIFREGVEWPWDNPITLWVNSGKQRDADYEKTAGPICMNAPQLLHRSSLLWGSTVGHPSDSWASCFKSTASSGLGTPDDTSAHSGTNDFALIAGAARKRSPSDSVNASEKCKRRKLNQSGHFLVCQ